MYSYDEFWEKLKPAYPVSGGKMKLPIATELELFEHIDFDQIVSDLDFIMQEIFKKKDESMRLAQDGYHQLFTDLYEDHNSGVVRFDCMFDKDNQLRLVEANTNWPDGLLMHDVTYSVLTNRPSNLHLSQYLSWFDKNEKICLLYEDHFFKDPHFLEHQKLLEHGFDAYIAVFSDLDFREDGVYFDDNKIDVLRLSMNSGRLTAEQLSLLKQSDVRFVNTFDLAGFADKSLLSGINHPMLMQTYILTDEVYFKVSKDKNNYVLKPTNQNEGNGVVLGIDCDQNQREELLKSKINKEYLIQEYIDISPKEAELYIDGSIKKDKMYYDFCPHLFYEKGVLVGVGHTLVRYSKNKIVNVLKGGGIGYYCLPQDRK